MHLIRASVGGAGDARSVPVGDVEYHLPFDDLSVDRRVPGRPATNAAGALALCSCPAQRGGDEEGQQSGGCSNEGPS